MNKSNRELIALLLLLVASTAHSSPNSNNRLAELEKLVSQSQWNEATEVALEILDSQPQDALSRIKGAYALFQTGHPNSALLLLTQISPGQWKSLPQGQDRLLEIITLFQKKVPLNILPSRLDQTQTGQYAGHLQNEIALAKGKRAWEERKLTEAQNYLNTISDHSRLSSQAHYLLGAIALQQNNNTKAQTEFSKVFDTSVFEQSTELWNDLSSQMTSHWGANLSVMLDASLIAESTRAGELSVLALARIFYEKKDFQNAISTYARISPKSNYYALAQLETIWALLSSNKHEKAATVATELSLNNKSFESIEAKIARATILIDKANIAECRKEIAEFNSILKAAENALHDYDVSQGLSLIPEFLQADIQSDRRISALLTYSQDIRDEIKSLRAKDASLYPLYSKLALSLDPLLQQSERLVGKLISEHVATRKNDLARLSVQARLITVETLLEERENLKNEYRDLRDHVEEKQSEHDAKLVQILTQAVNEIDNILSGQVPHRSAIEFRQSELLWELSSALSILGQVNKDEKSINSSHQFKMRSLQIAQDIIKKYPNFYRRPQAIFFSAYAQLDLGQSENAYRILEKYVEEYPQHQHVPDAYRILGDAQFDSNHFEKAENLYRKVLNYPNSPVLGYCFYKIGWSAYNRKDFARALLAFEKAVVWANEQQNHGSHLLSLKKEAQHDLVMLFAEIGDHRKAKSYFSQFFNEDPQAWLAELAKELDRIGQYEKASDVFQMLIAANPAAEDSLYYQACMIRDNLQLRRWDSLLSSAETLIDRYKSRFNNTENAAVILAESVLRDAVIAQHFEYQKRPQEEAAIRYAKLSRMYLSAFQDWQSAQKPLYFFASFLSEKDILEASLLFEKHWIQYQSKLSEPTKEESLRNLIHSLSNLPLDKAKDESLLNYISVYEQNYPKTKYTRTIAFLKPAILFKQEKIEEGIAASQALFDVNPTDEIGSKNFANMRVAYYKQKKWDLTYQWADNLYNKDPQIRVKYGSDLLAIREEALFLWAESAPSNDVAIELYLKLAHDSHSTKLKEKALYNVSLRFQSFGKNIDFIKTVGELEGSSPQSPLLTDLSGLRAASYQDAGDYERALPLLRTFLKSPPAGTSPSALKLAKQNEDLISKSFTAEHSSPKRPIPRNWPHLMELFSNYEKGALDSKLDLVSRIKKGSANLEKLTQQFITFSESPDNPTFYAFEAYCAVPLLYRSFTQSILNIRELQSLKGKEAAELNKELMTLNQPLEQKAKEMSDICLAKGADALHSGPFHQKVCKTWGWLSNATIDSKFLRLKQALEKKYPFLDSIQIDESEARILESHMKGESTNQTWYALAILRKQQNKLGLSKLTAIDGLNRFPNNSFLENYITTFQYPEGASQLIAFEKAAQDGSKAALWNLLTLRMKWLRLKDIQEILDKALSTSYFDHQSPEYIAAKELREIL